MDKHQIDVAYSIHFEGTDKDFQRALKLISTTLTDIANRERWDASGYVREPAKGSSSRSALRGICSDPLRGTEYLMICEKCRELYWSSDGFPERQLCSRCLESQLP